MNFVHACACEHVCAHISQRASHPLTCMACSRFSVDVVKPWRVRLGTKGWSDAQMHSSMFVRACTYMCIRNTILHCALYLSCGLILLSLVKPQNYCVTFPGGEFEVTNSFFQRISVFALELAPLFKKSLATIYHM